MKVLQIKDFLTNKLIMNEKLFVGKIKNVYLIGPQINENLDTESFYKRIISSCLFDFKRYKKLPKSKIKEFIDLYSNKLSDNEVLEISKNFTIVRYKIIKIPEAYNEK